MTPFNVHRAGDFIGGRFVQLGRSAGVLEDRNPADLSVLVGCFPWFPGHVELAVEAARAAQAGWAETALAQRIAAVESWLDALQERLEWIVAGIVAETGRPWWEARLEVGATLRACDLALAEAGSFLNERPQPRLSGTLRRRALGVVAVISPAPHPLFVPLSHMLPTLLAGNAVVFKPSSRWPGLAQWLMRAAEGRLPRGVLNMVQGPGREVGRMLVHHSGVDAVILGGSARTGRLVARELGRSRRFFHLAGAKAQAIVLDDCCRETTLHELMVGAFLTTGQRVNSTGRVFLQRSRLDSLLGELVEMADRLVIGQGAKGAEVFCGPLMSREKLRHHLAWVKRARRQPGVELLCGGERHPSSTSGHFVRPTILLDREGVLDDVEEAAGPILCVVPCEDLEHALTLHQRSRFALASSVFTRSQEHFDAAARVLPVGNLNWNRATVVASFQLPVSGQRASGQGHCGNLELYRFVTHPQATLTAPCALSPEQSVPGLGWPDEQDELESVG